ncbi:protein glass-like [Mercenaria mercenaria]|uniref:protein glass-like n=1 Tax=Mercenaria mercenaria TaxID=6596 RepID=UPI00234F7293|nr:protein glass-like [Mercenaria mercenaria]
MVSESEEREQPDSIDLTGDDDNDIDSTQVSGIISTVPNFTPGDAGSCNFSIVNVSSLSTPAQTVVPGFLYEQSVADIQIEGSSSFVPVGEDYDNRETIEEEPGDPNASWEHSDGSQATDASYYGNVKDNNEGHDVDDPTAFMRPSIPINPLKHVQFNKEFYGKKEKPQQYQPVQLIPYPPTSSREPVIFLQPITDQDQPITTPTDVKLTPTHDLASQASFTTMLTSFDFGTTQNVMTSDTVQDTPAAQNNQSKCSTFPQNMPKPSSSTFGTPPTFGPTPIPLSGNERIVIPSCADEQYLPFTKENYGKEKDKWVLKRHICQYCGKRCMKPSDLTRHIKIHTGEYPFECPSCKKRFREKFNLNAHFKKGSCTP